MATAGSILIGGSDVTRLPATDRDVSMVFQSYALFPHMSVLENVCYGLRASGKNKKQSIERAEYGLDLVGLAGYGARLPSELSGGQQQRVAVARALVLEPQVLLFDEPLSNLDAKLRRQVRDDIREIQQRLSLTVVYVTHDQEEALAVSDRIIVMKNAVIAQVGSPRELYEYPASEFVADFIGEANIIDAQVTAVSGDVATVEVGNILLSLDSRGLANGPAKLAVRPNRIFITPLQSSDNAGLQGVVEKATYVGDRMEYKVSTQQGVLFCTSEATDTQIAEHSDVAVSFDAVGPVLLPDHN
jgi:iron(III) transport system ATP-binding protein